MKNDEYFRQLDREFNEHSSRFRVSPAPTPTDEQIEEMHDAGAPWHLCECDLCDLLREIEREDTVDKYLCECGNCEVQIVLNSKVGVWVSSGALKPCSRAK